MEEKEAFINSNKGDSVEQYYGCGDTCRICDDENGCNEYSIDGFVWPSGYLQYLRDHNVECDKEFKSYLLTSNNK